MKMQKGVTLVSLTIYIIVMTIVISVISMISTYFFKNTKNILKDIEPITEQTRFSSFFTEEVNRSNSKILACDEHYVVFDDGVQYTFVPENKGVYRNQVKICRGVENHKKWKRRNYCHLKNGKSGREESRLYTEKLVNSGNFIKRNKIGKKYSIIKEELTKERKGIKWMHEKDNQSGLN